MSTQRTASWHLVTEEEASRIVITEARSGGGCGCGWYEFKGRCGHRILRQPFICGRESRGGDADFCRSAVNPDGAPKKIKQLERYRLDEDCRDCVRVKQQAPNQPAASGRGSPRLQKGPPGQGLTGAHEAVHRQNQSSKQVNPRGQETSRSQNQSSKQIPAPNDKRSQ